MQMKVYLVQHGEPVPKETDPERPLTEKGRADARKVARLLGMSQVKVPEAWHSGKTRARETAEILAAAIEAEVSKAEGLAPLDPVSPVRDKIEGRAEDLMLVGHLPFMARLASLLVLDNELPEIVAFRQGGIVCIEGREDGGWRVAWMVVPDLLCGDTGDA